MMIKSAVLALSLALLSVSVSAQAPPVTLTIQQLAQPDQTQTLPDGSTWVFSFPNTVNIGTATWTPASAPPPPRGLTNEKSTFCVGSSPGAPTCTSGSYNVVSGHSYIINPSACGAGCGTAVTTTVSGITDTTGSASLLGNCAVATGARETTSSPMKSEIWKCTATATGATAIKATWTAPVFWSSIDIADAGQSLTDDGKGNSFAGSGTSLSVSTNGATSQANELIVAALYCDLQGGDTVGTGYTLLPSGGMAYSGTNSAGVNGFNATCPGNGGNPFAVAIAAFR